MNSECPQDLPETDYVKLYHCPGHDTFHLWLGKATIHLSPRELLLLGAAIDRYWRSHPEKAQALQQFDFFPNVPTPPRNL